jgi:hypothetical protein
VRGVGKGGDGRSWVRLGREGIGVWPTQKLSCGAPYVPNKLRKITYFNAHHAVEVIFLWDPQWRSQGAWGYRAPGTLARRDGAPRTPRIRRPPPRLVLLEK